MLIQCLPYPVKSHDRETTAAVLGNVLRMDPLKVLAQLNAKELRLGEAQGRRRNQRARP